jgi:hypothetical protein
MAPKREQIKPMIPRTPGDTDVETGTVAEGYASSLADLKGGNTEDGRRISLEDDRSDLEKEIEIAEGRQARYVPWGLAQAAQDSLNKGVRLVLGKPWNALQIALREFDHEAVMERREYIENLHKMKENKAANQELPINVRILSSVESLGDQAVQGLNGAIDLTPFLTGREPKLVARDQAFAEKYGIEKEVDGVKLWIYETTWEKRVDREFLKELLFNNRKFRDVLFRAANHLKNVSDKQIVELGEDSVLGQDVGAGWVDSST